jgi:hypothetical protein
MFNSWIDSVRTIAIMHNSDNPLDPTYVPVTDVEIAIFRLDKTYMYAVAAKMVKYPSGKTIVATYKRTMDGQLTFKALCDEATGSTVRQINETKLKEALKQLDANPDKWSKTMESFVDTWLTKASQLDDVRLTPLPDDEKKTLFIEAVKHHPVAIAAIQQQEGIEKAMKRQFPNQNFVQTFDNLIDDIRMTCQQFDNVQGAKPHVKKVVHAETRRVNTAQTDTEKATKFAKYKESMKSDGLWIDPAVYSTWTPAQKKAHTEKAKAKPMSKKGTVTPAAVTPSPAPTPQPAPAPAPAPVLNIQPTYSQMVEPPLVFTMMGKQYKMQVAQRTYKSNTTPQYKGSLIDGGCNGGLAGDDCIIIDTHVFGTVDIVGVGDNLIKDIPLCTAAGYIETSAGPIIGIMHNYAALGKGGSIHSPLQMQDFGLLIDDKAKTQKRIDGEYGTQTVRVTSAGTNFDIPLVLHGGLPYFKMTAPTQEQLNNPDIPRVTLTSDMPWDPSKYDDKDAEDTNHVDGTLVEPTIDPEYDIYFAELTQERAYKDDVETSDEFEVLDDAGAPDHIFIPMPNVVQVMANICRTTYESKKTWLEHKYGKTLEQFRPNFAFASTERIKATVEASTQLYRASQKVEKDQTSHQITFPWGQCQKINETVCSDTAYMETKGTADGISGHGGAMGFQLFVGHDTKHLAVYMVQTDAMYPQCLAEYIRTHGAPKKMYCDNAKAETSEAAKELYRNFGVDDGNSEPYYQNQNAAEREIQDLKSEMAQLMNVTNTPYGMWPLCAEFVCLLRNHIARTSLKNRTPIEKRTGQTPDISKFLQYRWWEPVYFLDMDGTECLGRWAGVAEHVGDELTYIVISQKTNHAIYRSDIRTATDPNAPNFRAEVEAESKLQPSVPKDEGSQSIFPSFGVDDHHDEIEKVYPIAPEELVGKLSCKRTRMATLFGLRSLEC